MVPVFARPRRPGFRLGGRNDESGRVKCARSGAMHAGTAKHRLRFLGFARNDMRALQGNDKVSEGARGREGERARGREGKAT